MRGETAVGNRQSAVDLIPIADCRLPTANIREEIVAVARSWVGTPYRHQASLKGVGCDCLGLLIGVWSEVGGGVSRASGRGGAVPPIPPYTPDWAEAERRETFVEGLRDYLTEIDPRAAEAGDVVLFRWRAHLPAKHAAILTARDRMVHAQEKAAVTEVQLSNWWKRRMAYAFASASYRQHDALPMISSNAGTRTNLREGRETDGRPCHMVAGRLAQLPLDSRGRSRRR